MSKNMILETKDTGQELNGNGDEISICYKCRGPGYYFKDVHGKVVANPKKANLIHLERVDCEKCKMTGYIHE